MNQPAVWNKLDLRSSLFVITDTQSDLNVSPRASQGKNQKVLVKSPTQDNLLSQSDRLITFEHVKATAKDAISAGNPSEPQIAEIAGLKAEKFARKFTKRANKDSKKNFLEKKKQKLSKFYPPFCRIKSDGNLTHDYDQYRPPEE